MIWVKPTRELKYEYREKNQEKHGWQNCGLEKRAIGENKDHHGQGGSAMAKLVEREWTYSTPNACEEARKKLHETYYFCAKLHDRWSDLEAPAASMAESVGKAEPSVGSIAKRAADSIKPYN